MRDREREKERERERASERESKRTSERERERASERERKRESERARGKLNKNDTRLLRHLHRLQRQQPHALRACRHLLLHYRHTKRHRFAVRGKRVVRQDDQIQNLRRASGEL